MPFNELEVSVGANTAGLRSGLRNANREQRRYARNTERTFSRLGRRVGGFARGGAMGVLGAGLGQLGLGLGAGASIAGIRRVGDQFNQMSEIQRRSLTTGQRNFREFAGEVSLHADIASTALEDMTGRLLRLYGFRGRRFNPLQPFIRAQLEAFQARATVAATPFGRDIQRIASIQEQRRRIAMQVQFAEFTRQQRQGAVDPMLAGLQGLGGVAGGGLTPPTANIQQRAGISAASATARGISGPLGVVLSIGRALNMTAPATTE
jgi:hypothetical protein